LVGPADMFSRTSTTNLSEIGLGDGLVVPKEDRVIAAHAKPMVAALRESIRSSKVSGVVMGHRKDGSSISVQAKFTVDVGDEMLKFSVHVMKDGAWSPGSLPAILKMSKIQAAARISKEVASIALKYSGLKPLSLNEDFASPDDRVRGFLEASLADDIALAESRLRAEASAVIESPSSRTDARNCWENAVRHIVHKALEGLEGLPPELLHRLVDELYAKEIHES